MMRLDAHLGYPPRHWWRTRPRWVKVSVALLALLVCARLVPVVAEVLGLALLVLVVLAVVAVVVGVGLLVVVGRSRLGDFAVGFLLGRHERRRDRLGDRRR
jgi:hypothetical protein